MINHWKALVLYFQNLQKKLKICKNWIFFCKIQLYSKNVCKKKIVQKVINYTFLKKPLTMPFQICNKFCKIFNNLIVIGIGFNGFRGHRTLDMPLYRWRVALVPLSILITIVITFSCPQRVQMGLTVRRSNSLTVLSWEADTRQLPDG